MVQPARRTRLREKQHVETHEAVITVTASGVGVDTDERKVIEVREFKTDPAYVRVGAGVTKRIADYESLRVDVSISVPCYVEEIEEVQKRTASLVADMLDEEVEQYLGQE